MEITAILIILGIGAVAGWLAGIIMKGGGFGFIGDIVIGIIGAFVGGFILGKLGISLGAGIVGEIFSATIGAVILLAVISVIKKIL